MLFSSPEFIIFIFCYVIAHILTPVSFRVYLIIFGSTIFYAWWKIEYIWIPYLLMGIAYFSGRWFSMAGSKRNRKQRLLISIIMLFTPLFIYKYLEFILKDIIGIIIPIEDKLLNVSLPLGISFITFTLTSYLMDVYKNCYPHNKPISVVLAYVLFFPHLIAGPILHPKELIPQLENPRPFNFRRILVALAIFSVGLLKKLVFADQIGEMVDGVYEQTGILGGAEATLAILGFTVQIFCDFSGYTDMAIGVAMLIGIKLPNNFERPYTATSISGLWRRWHITLTRFLMEYVYTPLTLKARHLPFYRRYIPLFKVIFGVIVPINITFLISGIWHGAGWNFIYFGIVNGLALTIDSLWRWAHFPKLYRPLAWALSMSAFMISAVFFRSSSITQANAILVAPLLGDWSESAMVFNSNLFPITLIAIFALTHWLDDHRRVKLAIIKLRPEFVWSAIVFCWLLSVVISQGSSGNFVYFDF
jgi:alginate O-acetyltransferase complex protein AlgI